MTDQEAFDKMVRHLQSQNWKQATKDEFGGCAYRGDNGKMCAVGCLIPDSEYIKSIEFKDYQAAKELCPSLANISGAVLNEMQLFHDEYMVDCIDNEEIKNDLNHRAERLGLSNKVLEEIL